MVKTESVWIARRKEGGGDNRRYSTTNGWNEERRRFFAAEGYEVFRIVYVVPDEEETVLAASRAELEVLP